MSKKKKSEKLSKGKDKSGKNGYTKGSKDKSGKSSVSKEKKQKPVKVVRDSFTMPKTDYIKIKELKSRYLEYGISIKKGELLRAGLYALEQMDKAQLQTIIGNIERVKTGRPKKKADD